MVIVLTDLSVAHHNEYSTTQMSSLVRQTSICPSRALLCAEAPSIFDRYQTCPGPGCLYFHSVVFTLTAILAPGQCSCHDTLKGNTPQTLWFPACACSLKLLGSTMRVGGVLSFCLTAHIGEDISCSRFPRA